MKHCFLYLQGFLTHHNLQGSQTENCVKLTKSPFLTHHNLQGSQTMNC